MLTTIKGIYENGKITLYEQPVIKEPVEVLVTFTEAPQKEPLHKAPVFGYNKGTVVYIAPDFDEPLDELSEYM